MPPRRRRGRLAAWLLVPALLTTCGDGDGEARGAGSTTTTAASTRPDFLAAEVQVRAEDIKFPQREYIATAGDVVFGYVNDGKIRHTLVLERSGGATVAGWERLDVPEFGDVALGTVRLTPATYALYCDIPGHRRAGMEATLTVTA